MPAQFTEQPTKKGTPQCVEWGGAKMEMSRSSPKMPDPGQGGCGPGFGGGPGADWAPAFPYGQARGRGGFQAKTRRHDIVSFRATGWFGEPQTG